MAILSRTRIIAELKFIFFDVVFDPMNEFLAENTEKNAAANASCKSPNAAIVGTTLFTLFSVPLRRRVRATTLLFVSGGLLILLFTVLRTLLPGRMALGRGRLLLPLARSGRGPSIGSYRHKSEKTNI
jgi:hypothetical protein